MPISDSDLGAHCARSLTASRDAGIEGPPLAAVLHLRIDFFARGAHGELIRVACGGPHLPTQGNNGLAHDGRFGDAFLAYVVRIALLITRSALFLSTFKEFC